MFLHKAKSLCLRFKGTRSSTLDGDPYILHDNGTIEIPVAQTHNSGKYMCVARNTLGISENHVFLEVKGEGDFALKVFKINTLRDS